MFLNRNFVSLIIGTLIASTASLHAQTFPTKPIRVIVPLAAGGPGDVLTRALGQKLSEQLGRQIVVDNRPGANTNVGAEFVAKAPADGYTLLSTANPLTTNPSLYATLPYDPIKDFAPIALPQAKAGKLRALGSTGAGRLATAPDVLPIAELGLPGYEVSVWYGVLAPTGTPAAAITRLYNEITKIVLLPEIKERWAALGAEPLQSTPEKFAAFLKADVGKWAKVIREAGVKID